MLPHTSTQSSTEVHIKLSGHGPPADLCNSLQHTATHCSTATRSNILKHAATRCNIIVYRSAYRLLRSWTTRGSLQLTATHCNTLQHTAAHCSTLQHTETRCNTLQHNRLQKRISASQAMDHPWIKFQGESFKSSTPPSLPHAHSHVHTQIHACYCGMGVCVCDLWGAVMYASTCICMY